MPVNKHVQQQEMEKHSTEKQALTTALRKSGRKAPGTRVGTLVDWREASHNNSGRHGYVLRDGR